MDQKSVRIIFTSNHHDFISKTEEDFPAMSEMFIMKKQDDSKKNEITQAFCQRFKSFQNVCDCEKFYDRDTKIFAENRICYFCIRDNERFSEIILYPFDKRNGLATPHFSQYREALKQILLSVHPIIGYYLRNRKMELITRTPLEKTDIDSTKTTSKIRVVDLNATNQKSI